MRNNLGVDIAIIYNVLVSFTYLYILSLFFYFVVRKAYIPEASHAHNRQVHVFIRSFDLIYIYQMRTS